MPHYVRNYGIWYTVKMRKRRNILISLFVVYSLFNNNLPLSYASQENRASHDNLFVSAPEAGTHQHNTPSMEGLLAGIAQDQIAQGSNSYAFFSLYITELFVQACADSPDYSIDDIRNVYRPRKEPAVDTLSRTEEIKPDEGFIFLRSDLSPPFYHVT